MMNTHQYRALILNADYRPLTTSPLSVFSWKDAVKAAFSENFTILETYDKVIRSPSFEMRLPAVMAIRHYIKMNKPAPLTRWNLFLAHRFRCALCGNEFSSEDLTFDHIHPKSKGGQSTWQNLVPACQPCNHRKGNKTLQEAKITLKSKPYRPTQEMLNEIGMEFSTIEETISKPWLSWLYWKGSIIEP